MVRGMIVERFGVIVVAAALLACRSPRHAPAVRARAVASQPAPAATEPEPARAAELTPGSYVVVAGIGLMQVTGPHEFDGKPGLAFSNEETGMGYRIDLERAKDPTVVRAVISKTEAARRLALLEDTTPVTDTRSAQARYVERTRTLARGTGLQKLALLRAAYASTFAPPAHDTEIRQLEDEVLPELAYVLGTPREQLAATLHAIHAERGTFAKTAKPRPPEPDPVPPKDPWSMKGYDYVGTFTLAGESLIAGDPIYVTSTHDEPPQDVTKNVRIPALAGRWLCYVELDPKDPGDVTMSFIAIHESARADFQAARRKAAPVAKLWVDSGDMSVVDAAIRDDATYDDARLFGADDLGVIRGRGCKVQAGAGDGTYTTRVLARDGKAIYVDVDFSGESRDFLRGAKAKLKL